MVERQNSAGDRARGAGIGRFDLSQACPSIGIQCAISIGLPLLVGILAGHVRAGGWGAVGAFLADMAVFQPGHRFRARIVAGAALAVATGGFLGALIGIHSLAIYPVVALWTASAGLLVAVSSTAALVGVSSATGMVYAASLRLSAGQTWGAGLVMLASGLGTAGVAYAWRRVIKTRSATGADAPAAQGTTWVAETFRSIARSLTTGSTTVHHAVRLTVGTVLGTVFFRLIDPVDGFWIPEAVLFIIKPDPHLTRQRCVLRVLGTVSGVTLTTLLLTTLRPSPTELAIIAVVASAVAFSVQRVNFGLYITFVTCIFVFLTAFAGLPRREAVVDRLVDNLIGSAIALATLMLWPRDHAPARPPNR
jgi:hypothetical protein